MLSIQEEKITLPTYEVGSPDVNPLFLDKRVYQASSGKIYPYQIIDKIYDEKIDKEYDVITIENDYIKIMIMPSLGGRIQYGYDKINEYYFFYNNEVIKPALVGLCGPWLSGGVEFNWPQHHRPSTFEPLQYEIQKNEEFVIVWLNEFEKMSELIGVAGIKVYNDSNRVEVIGRSINNTNIPKTFLWWANIAVHCHEGYESFFPRDVNFVADHGKREVTSYPFANTQYYNIDYPNYQLEARNITNYKNIKAPMSYMAVGSKYNFFGGYDFKRDSGTMHVSNTHTAPGKKQWTWGSDKFGQAWDRNLTDKNGPYVELMAGVYTDNQPDFTWLSPGETKEFSQTWYPFTDVEKALNANEYLAYNIVDDQLVVYSTINQELHISIRYKNDDKLESKKQISVGQVVKLKVGSGICEINVNELVYRKEKLTKAKEFNPAIEPKKAKDITSSDELYNIGIHLEQYRHASRNPLDYYLRALEIDQSDARVNTRLGFINLQNGELNTSKTCFETAISTLTKYNPNPKECDAYFGLATVYKYLGDDSNAYKNFYKSIWDNNFKSKGYLELAKLDFKHKRFTAAYDSIKTALKYDETSLQALTLRELIKQKLYLDYDYSKLVVDKPYNYYARLFDNHVSFLKYINSDDKTILELVEFLDELGLVDKACDLIDSSNSEYPVLQVYQGIKGCKFINRFSITNCMPNTLFERLLLESYLEIEYSCELEYLLSILLIDKNQKDAAYVKLNNCYKKGFKNSIFLRVLGQLEFNLNKCGDKALSYYEEAIEYNKEDSRLVYEYDQLKKILNVDPIARLDYLNENLKHIEYRDDLKVEYSWLLCQLGEYEECLDYMVSTKFHPFEGGEGKVIEIYKTAKLAIVKQLIANQQYSEGLKILLTINDIPECLGEDIIWGSPNADIEYFKGVCYLGLGEQENAHSCFKSCIEEKVITSSELSYKPEKLQMNYYQALANEKVGNIAQKNVVIKDLEKLSLDKLNVDVEVDYFAISVPEFSIFDVDANDINKAHSYFLLALCAKAKGDNKQEEFYKDKCREIDRSKLELILID